jgi:hypothetical protein
VPELEEELELPPELNMVVSEPELEPPLLSELPLVPVLPLLTSEPDELLVEPDDVAPGFPAGLLLPEHPATTSTITPPIAAL